MARSHRSSRALAFLLPVVSACTPEPGECSYDETLRESIRYFGHDGSLAEQCPGSYDAAQAHLEWVWEAWNADGGQVEAEPPPVQYAVYASRDSACWPCPEGAGGCAAGDTLSTVSVPHRHELSHVARGQQCGILLEEGWAKLYDNLFLDHTISGTIPEAIETIETTGSLPGGYYGIAGKFAAFLIETRGVAAFRELCTEPTNSSTDLDAAAQKILGVGLPALLDEFDSWPSDGISADVGAYRQDLACEAVPDSALSLPASWMMALDCEDLAVEGSPLQGLTKISYFEITEPGSYVFELTAAAAVDAELTVELRNCERQGLRSTFHISGSFPITDTIPAEQRQPEILFAPDMPAGIYLARVRVVETDGTSSFDVGLSGTPQDSWEP